MKNNRIVRAYDSINPSPAEKAKMLDAILAEANLEEKPTRERKQKHTVVYTAKAPKPSKRSNFVAIAASLVLLLISGLVLVQMVRQSDTVSYTRPEETVNLGTPYDAVLNKYKIALEEGWSVDQCQIEDICAHVTTTNYSALNVGYSILDLDSNGREELVITNGQGLVWDLYTLLEDGTPVHVHSQEDGWPVYRLYENGIICAEDFDAGKVYEYYVYQDGAFTGPELVIRQESGMFTYEPEGEEASFITEAEAEAKMAEYRLQELDQTSLLSLVSDAVAEKYLYGSNTKYAEIIAKYNQAIAEGWTKEQCANEGISLRMQAGYDVTKAGYAFLDLDGDGREELIIAEESTDRTDNIWVLYTTLEDGTPIQLWVDELTGGQCRLYEGNVISISDAYKDELEMTFYELKAGQLVMRENLQWEDEDTVFHTDADGNTRQVTPREGQDISYAYEGQKLNLIWLTGMPNYLRDSDAMERYLPTIEKYRTAIEEGWNRTMCNGNGMSMCTPIESAEESLYYALYDLNGDGTEELIISEYPYRENTDTRFIDIYTVHDGKVKNVMSLFDLAGMRSLCEGGFVKDLFFEPGREWDDGVSFLRLEGDMFVNELAVYKKNNQWFTEGYRGVGTTITREEADEIVANYPPLKLDFTEIKPSGETEYQSGYEVFDDIIQKYVTAINEGWTEHKCEQNEISPQILSDTCIQYDLGWCLVDVDGNGVEELVVSDGVHLFDLYVMMPHDGSPGHLVMANGGETWQLCENGVLQKHGLYSGATAWRFYTLSDIELIQRDMVFYEGETNQYSYGKDDKDLAPISKEQVGNILQENRTMELELTRFVDPEPFVPEEQKYYEPLLDIYRQAVREKWNPGQCMENGISLMVGYYGELYGELGYSMMDLDGNGIQELIITDGSNIFDLYTIIRDEETGPLQLLSAMERLEYHLLEDLNIYCLGSGGAALQYHTLYLLDGRELVVLEGYAYDADRDPNNPWYFYDGETVGDSCGSFDPQSVINDYLPMGISNISLA